MAEQSENQQQETEGQQDKSAKRNKDGLVPGQRVSPKELAAVRLKQRKAAKK